MYEPIQDGERRAIDNQQHNSTSDKRQDHKIKNRADRWDGAAQKQGRGAGQGMRWVGDRGVEYSVLQWVGRSVTVVSYVREGRAARAIEGAPVLGAVSESSRPRGAAGGTRE